MNNERSMVYLLVRNSVMILAAALIIGLFLVGNKIAYAFGIGLGGVVSIGKIFLMENTFRRAVHKQAHQATNFVRAHYFLRYTITFIILFIGVITPEIDLIGLIIGLFILKPAAYIQGLLEPPVPKDGSVEFQEWEEEDEDEKSDFW
jgi:hypothetical protein